MPAVQTKIIETWVPPVEGVGGETLNEAVTRILDFFITDGKTVQLLNVIPTSVEKTPGPGSTIIETITEATIVALGVDAGT